MSFESPSYYNSYTYNNNTKKWELSNDYFKEYRNFTSPTSTPLQRAIGEYNLTQNNGGETGNMSASYNPNKFATDFPQLASGLTSSGTIKNSGGGSYTGYGAYTSPYESQINSLLSAIQGSSFNYNYLDDPVYQQYAKQYAIQGRNAMADTMGEYASMTGGLPSSYAVTAGQQAENSYNTALNNIIPELQNARYQKYLGELENKYNMLNAYMNLDSTAYGRYADARDYNLSLQKAQNSELPKTEAELFANNGLTGLYNQIINKYGTEQNGYKTATKTPSSVLNEATRNYSTKSQQKAYVYDQVEKGAISESMGSAIVKLIDEDENGSGGSAYMGTRG